MKTLLKLILVAAVLHATWRIGGAYWDHYRFEDNVREAAQFSQRATAADISARVLALAEEMNIPLSADDLTVSRDQHHVTVDAAYVRDVEVLPKWTRRWEFSIHVNVL